MPLLDIEVPSVGESLAEARNSLATEYAELERADGTRISPHKADNLLYPLGNTLGRLGNTLALQTREVASQATPFGARGAALDQFLEIYGILIPPPQVNKGTVELTGEDVTVPAGTELVAQDGSQVFTLDTAVIFGASQETIQAAVTATESGSDHNLAAGDLLAVGLLLDGLEPTAVWVEVTQAGRDPANDDEKAALLQSRLQQGNGVIPVRSYLQLAALFDPTFGTIYLVPHGAGPGTVRLYPTLDLPAATAAAAPWTVLLPSQGQVDALEAYLQQDSVRAPNDRMLADLLTLTPHTFDVTIVPDTADTRAEVEAALGTRLLAGYTAASYTIANSEIASAIGALESITSHTLDDVNGAGPDADITTVVGELATLGTVSFS